MVVTAVPDDKHRVRLARAKALNSKPDIFICNARTSLLSLYMSVLYFLKIYLLLEGERGGEGRRERVSSRLCAERGTRSRARSHETEIIT